MSSLASAIKSSTVTPQEAALLIPVYLPSKLRYKFAATMFSQSECESIDKTFRSTVIAKMGYCSTTSTCIINGSYLYGGAQIPSSWDLQGANHLQLLIGHLQLQDLVGQYLLFTINLLYLHIGLLDCPMSYDFQLTKNTAPPSWVTNTWTYASSIQATVKIPSFRLYPQRENDASIMSIASKYYNGITYERINAVRKFQRLFLVSDITTSDGKSVDKEFLYPTTDRSRRSKLFWPAQSLPGPKAWSEWRQFITTYLCSAHLSLRQSLGLWLPVKHRSQLWYSYFSPQTNLYYLYDKNNTWAICSSYRSSRRRIEDTQQTTRTLPTTLIPITVHYRRGLLITERYCNLFSHQSVTSIPDSLQDYLQSLPKPQQWILGSVLSPTSTELTHLITCIQEGSFALGSDGSVKNSIGTYASRLQSLKDPTIFIQLRKKFITSTVFTAETYGHLSILLLLCALILCYHIQFTNTPSIINSYIDNLGLIKRLNHGVETSISHTQHPDADLIREIHTVTDSLPFSLQRHHVRSHQYDNTNDLDDIPVPERINKMCNISADLAYNDPSCPSSPPPLELLPQTRAAILWHNKLHTHKIISTFTFAFQDSQLRDYISKKANWNPSTTELISWIHIKTALLRTTSSVQCKAFIKFSHKLLATNEIRNQRNRSHDHRCTRCHCSHEDWDHIFQCRKLNQDFLTSTLSVLRSTLQSLSLSKPMIFLLIHGITSWLKSDPIIFPSSHLETIHSDPDLQLLLTAFSDQTNIGWDHLLCGRIASSWFSAHSYYHQQRHLRPSCSSKNIGPKLVLSMWHFGLAFWYHRNGSIYGSDDASVNDFQRQQLHDKITSAFDDPDLITNQADYETLFSIDKDNLLIDTKEAQINWILYYESCLEAPPSPTNISEPAEPNQQLHDFFRPFSHLYKSYKSPSSFSHCS